MFKNCGISNIYTDMLIKIMDMGWWIFDAGRQMDPKKYYFQNKIEICTVNYTNMYFLGKVMFVRVNLTDEVPVNNNVHYEPLKEQLLVMSVQGWMRHWSEVSGHVCCLSFYSTEQREQVAESGRFYALFTLEVCICVRTAIK